MIVGEVMKVNCCEEKLKMKEEHCHVLFAPLHRGFLCSWTRPDSASASNRNDNVASAPACLLIEFNVV